MTLTSPPTTTLSRSLLLRITAVVVLCLGVFGTSFYLLVVNPAVDRLARGELSRGMSRVEGALQDNLSAVESLLKAACGWAVGGRLPIDDVRGFNGLLMPLLANDRRISSVLYADEDGNELLLLRTASGWHNRITTAGEIGKRNRILEWSEDGQLLDQAWRPSRYDPRLRPWFVGAMMQGEDHETFWTTPYRFFTTGDPGISASVRWTTAGGTTRILAFDMLLADLSALTSQLEVGRNGGVAVLTDEGSVLGLPRHTNFQDPLAVREAVLKPADRIGVRYSPTAWASGESSANPPTRASPIAAMERNGSGIFRVSSSPAINFGSVASRAAMISFPQACRTSCRLPPCCSRPGSLACFWHCAWRAGSASP